MDEQLAPTPCSTLQDRLNAAFTDWLDWFQAKPPFAIDVKNLEVAVATAEMCGLAGPPMKPNAFDLGRAKNCQAPVDADANPLAAMRAKVLASIAEALASFRHARPMLAEVCEPEWIQQLAGWLAELECHARMAGGGGNGGRGAFPPSENQALRCVYVLYQLSQMMHELSLIELPMQAAEPITVDGEWSAPMSKAEMARRIGLKARTALGAFTK